MDFQKLTDIIILNGSNQIHPLGKKMSPDLMRCLKKKVRDEIQLLISCFCQSLPSHGQIVVRKIERQIFNHF